MSLTSTEERRLAYLVQRAQLHQLTFQEEHEMRTLLARQDPRAQDMTVADLIALALLIIGAGALFAWLASKLDE